MRDLEEILKEICDERAFIKRTEDYRMDLLQSGGNAARRDELSQDLERQIRNAKDAIDGLVSELVRWPPHQVGHFAGLKQFFAQFPYEKSVFIMTKYPANPPGPLDQQLQTVIDTVRAAVTVAGFTPHLASDKQYHPELFRNIELYLLGCSKAIAIVESKHTQELNPNVTMEWGWLRCTDRKVLYLVEKDFDRKRADIEGLIKEEFVWDNPQPGIDAAVQAFLKP